MKAYIAGKVTGLPEDQVKAKFGKKKEVLEAKGYQVYCPVSQVWAAGLEGQEWDVIMKTCIPVMLQCDEVHLLPCWQDSRGAVLERDIAVRLGMRVVYP